VSAREYVTTPVRQCADARATEYAGVKVRVECTAGMGGCIDEVNAGGIARLPHPRPLSRGEGREARSPFQAGSRVEFVQRLETAATAGG
jgi:hypothetical protein